MEKTHIIKFTDLNGDVFVTNGVLFDNLIQEESANLSDKTWQRQRNWPGQLLYNMVTKKVTEAVEIDIDAQGCYRLDGHQFRYAAQPPIAVRSYWNGYLLREVISPKDGPPLVEREASFNVISSSGDVIFTYPDDDNAWEIIHMLSGQSDRRDIRLEIANTRGRAMTEVVTAPQKKQGQILALARFAKSDRGGYINRRIGKYVITQENIPGYYRVTKELDRIRFATLVKELKEVK